MGSPSGRQIYLYNQERSRSLPSSITTRAEGIKIPRRSPKTEYPSCLRRSIPRSEKHCGVRRVVVRTALTSFAYLPRIALHLLLAHTDVGVGLDDRLDLGPQMLPGVGIVDMIQDKVPQLIRSEERLGGLDRVDIVRVLLQSGSG